MPRKNRTTHISEIIPPFNAGDLFTYFKDLNRISGNVPRDKQAHKVAKAASSALNFSGGQLNEGTEIIESAINFLGKAAASEQQKEINAIMQYKEKLKAELKNWQNAPELSTLIDELEKIDLTQTDFSSYRNFSLKLTKAINLIKQQQDNYIARLERILNSNLKQDFTTKELFGQQIQYRLHEDVEGLIKDSIGLYVKESKDAEDNVAKILRNCVEDYLFSDKNKLNSLSGTDIAALMAAVTTDISILAQEEFNRQQLQSGQIQQQITADIVKQVYDRYKQATDTAMTKLQQVYNNGQQEELQEILGNMKKAFGIQKVDLAADKISNLRNKALSNIESSKGQQRNRGAKELQKTLAGQEIFNKLLNVKISTRTNQSHGNVEEGVRSIISNALLTRGRGATDMISLGSIILNAELSMNSANINSIGRAMRNTIDEYVNKNILDDRFDSYAEQYSEMNDKIRELINQLKSIILQDPELDQLFIFHETIKSYMSIEGDITSRVFNGFHGTQMQIFTAFDRLYSMAGIADIQFMQQDEIKMIALNLSSGALGSHNKSKLEEYLSIFAGLLMFDDIKNIAIDTALNLEKEPVQQVHVYLLNDTYVPSSVILTNIYQQLEQGLNSIDIGEAAKVHITTNGIDNAIADYNPKTYDISQWPIYAETARTSTLITIFFLSSFVNFLHDLFNM